MLTSPNQYDPDSDRAKLERGIAALKIIKNAYASVVCFNVSVGLGRRPELKRLARISLAANTGLLKLLHKRIEGR